MNYHGNETRQARISAPVRMPGRWSRLGWRGRSVVALLAVLVLVMGGFGIAAGLLFWRLSNGPMALDSLQPSIEAFFNDQLGEARARIGRVWLINDRDKGLVVRLDRVGIFDAEGRPLVSAPEAAMGTSLISALTGSLSPTSVELIGPHIRVRRHADGRVELGFASQAELLAERGPARAETKGDAGEFTPDDDAATTALAPSPAPDADAGEPGGEAAGAGEEGVAPSIDPASFVLGDGGDSPFGSIDNLVVSRARLSVYDDAAGANWESYGAELRISRPGGGLLVDVDAPFLTESGEWRIRAAVAQREPGGVVGIDTTFDAVVPSEIAARSPQLAYLAGLSLPVTGRVSVAVTPDFGLQNLAVDLAFGAGFVTGPEDLDLDIRPTLIDEGHIRATYRNEDRRLDIEAMEVMVGGNRFRVFGTAEPETTEAGALRSVRFDLRSEGLRLSAEDIDRPPLVVRRGLATGRVLLDPRSVELEAVSVELAGGGQITLGGNIALGGERAVTLNGQFSDLTIDGMLQMWPRLAAPGARAWVAENMTAGQIPKGRIAVHLVPEDFALARAGMPMPNDDVDIRFDLKGVTAHYLGGMPPIENASGTAVLGADRFRISVDEGVVVTPAGNRLKIGRSRFAIPSFAEEKTAGHSTGQIDVSISGPLSGALEILDMEPLGWAREMGVEPTATGGEADINLDIALPLLAAVEFAQTRIQAGARIKDLSAPKLFGNVDVDNGDLTILATQEEIQANGRVRLGRVDSNLKWIARIDRNGRRSDRILLDGTVEAAMLKDFGIDLGGLITGPMPIRLEATGRSSELTGASIDADVTGATLSLPTLGWSKPEGEEARLRFDVEMLDNDQVRLRNIRLEGKDVAVTGAIRLDPDGSLYKADLDQVKLGRIADVAVNGVRGGDRVLRLKVRGQSLDSRPVLDSIFAKGAETSEGGEDIDASFAIVSVRGRNETDIRDAEGTLQLRAGKVTRLRLDGAFASGRGISVTYGRSGSRPGVLNIKTGDAGGFARLLGLYRRAYGGTLSLDARSDGNGKLEGVASARSFSVRDEPLFQQLAAAQGGGGGRDIAFTELQLRFRTDGDQVAIDNAILNGPGMGVRVDGGLNIASDQVSIKGTYVPAYGLNSIPAGIPLVGWVLTGRAGEGVVGMTFRVEGDMSNPRVQVNPLSAIAPGILRSLFEFRGR